MSGRIKANITYTHYGHETELQHTLTYLTNPQRQEIAAKHAQGVITDKILDDVREKIGENFTRLHLLEKSDIQNIEKEFGIKSVQRHPHDQISVLSLIRELGETEGEDTPILYFKQQGKLDPQHPQFTREDFMVVIQTKAQRERAKRYGNDGLCCDATHGTTLYDFPLTTLLVIDEFGEGQPIGRKTFGISYSL